jgi:hypothetical protein
MTRADGAKDVTPSTAPEGHGSPRRCAQRPGSTGPSLSVTVLTCLDADRLDIPRVGLAVRPGLLFNPAAREPRMLEWASDRAGRLVVPSLCDEEWGWQP